MRGLANLLDTPKRYQECRQNSKRRRRCCLSNRHGLRLGMRSAKLASPQAGRGRQREANEAFPDSGRLDSNGRPDRRDGPSSKGLSLEVLAWTADAGAQTETSVPEPAHAWSEDDSGEIPKTQDSIEIDREMWRTAPWNKCKPHRARSMHKRKDGVSLPRRQNRWGCGRRAFSAQSGLNYCSH